MTKPMVERYEQILAQDPTSTVFVELAKALIERGEHQRAIEVCKHGLMHHKTSVVGRVLWGKALINLGRPAEAMEQFDQAIAIDRENPHAYNLIGEVLLHKGLYRSALPLLKKAVALQPNDGRVRQWLEQTQRALSGGPAPVLTELTAVDPVDPSAMMTDPGHGPASSRPAVSAIEPSLVPTEVNIAAYVPGQDERDRARNGRSRTPVEPPTAENPVPPSSHAKPPPPPVDDEPADPFDAVAARSTAQPETVGGLTATFDSLKQEPISEQTIIPSKELFEDGEVQQIRRPKDELLSDVPATSTETHVSPPPVLKPAAPSRASGGGLLDDIPDMVEPPVQVEVPKVEISPQATEAIAKEYERELRAKLLAQKAQQTFLQRHGGKVTLMAIIGAAAAGFAGFYAWTLHKNRGQDVKDALAKARKLILEDTQESYLEAIATLERAIDMAGDSDEAWARMAYAHAVLYAEHSGEQLHKEKALSARARPNVQVRFRELDAAVQYLIDSREQKESVRNSAQEKLLEQSLDKPEVHELAGRLLLARKKPEQAIKRLQRAIELNPTHVRALVALGNYYLENRDYEQALKLFSGAASTLSPKHPLRAIGAAESRLELSRELDVALEEVNALPTQLPHELLSRRQLALGRLLSANGRHDEALKTLEEGAAAFPALGYAFNMALGEASRNAGDMASAEAAYVRALELDQKSEEAREGLARALIARDREREALSRLGLEPSRRLSLLRGVAYARLGEWKRARAELAKTQLDGKFPAEAVITLALADAAEGQADRATEVLEKALASSKKAKADVRVALGRIYWQQGQLEKARKQLEEAAKDPLEYEGACSLGRLLLQLGLPDVALEPLEKAVARNRSHNEALAALAQVQLTLGKVEDAVKTAQLHVADNPGSADAQKNLALALVRAGRFKDAEAPSARAVRLAPSDARAFRVRAQALFGKGDAKGAFSALERANKLDPKDADTFCEIGHAFVRVGRGEMALAAFEAARREDPKSACGQAGVHAAKLPAGAKGASKELASLAATAVRHWDRAFALATLARAHLASGHLKEARKAAEDAVKLAPAMGHAHWALGLVAAKQKDDGAAKDALSRAVELEPAHGPIRLAYADLLAKSEVDLERAASEYEAFLRIGGADADVQRVKRKLPDLKKRLAQR